MEGGLEGGTPEGLAAGLLARRLARGLAWGLAVTLGTPGRLAGGREESARLSRLPQLEAGWREAGCPVGLAPVGFLNPAEPLARAGSLRRRPGSLTVGGPEGEEAGLEGGSCCAWRRVLSPLLLFRVSLSGPTVALHTLRTLSTPGRT